MKTAVEWYAEEFAERLEEVYGYKITSLTLLTKAKEMEKQQQGYSEEEVKSAFKIGFSIGYGSDVHAIDEKNRTCEEWFEKFKKK
jgi:hypothetical protein